MNQFVIVRHYIVQRPVSCGRDMLQILFEMKQVSYLSLIKLVIFAASFFQEYPPLSNTISFFFGKLFSPCYKKKKKGRKKSHDVSLKNMRYAVPASKTGKNDT